MVKTQGITVCSNNPDPIINKLNVIDRVFNDSNLKENDPEFYKAHKEEIDECAFFLNLMKNAKITYSVSNK